ncbi:hypothetical protein NMY22_g199 [Coprinellus aureogranulatus]|nr:hypothetical protein NMY22_g199 [Coprinellus aureogranulatus]
MAGSASNFNAGVNAGVISQVNSTSNLNLVEINSSASGRDPALTELYANIAAGAMHNSAERCDAPKCHPETRKAVQENIFGWIDDGEPGQLLWLTGPAGAGKTAIMGSICDKLKETEQLAATFYFTAYTGGLERRSKDGFVTTLAYQLHAHPRLHDQLSEGMLSTIRQDPAIFRMGLKEQMEGLVLQHLRSTQGRSDFHRSGIPLIIIVDGVDECGLDQYDDPRRSRQNDQIDVLTVLLDAVLDPSFPCRVVIASRPENRIRRFFTETAAGHFTEIFLDDKFNPDKDIKLFLKSKFTELSRRYGFAPSTWPRKEDIRTLVSNASGQFIYAATVLRFIEFHGKPPKKQLDIVLGATPLESGESPLAALDFLYIAILKSSPSPSETVLWLKAQQRLSVDHAPSHSHFPPSAWTIDRLFESSEGQAQLLFGLPSLVFTQLHHNTDSSWYGRHLPVPSSSIPNPSWSSTYSFYHKSFLDFLGSPARSRMAFPDITNERVVQWIWERLQSVLKCAGPEVPIDEVLLYTFRTCFVFILWNKRLYTDGDIPILRQEVLSECDPTAWFTGSSAIREGKERFVQVMYILVHTHPNRDSTAKRLWKEGTPTPELVVPPSPFLHALFHSYGPTRLRRLTTVWVVCFETLIGGSFSNAPVIVQASTLCDASRSVPLPPCSLLDRPRYLRGRRVRPGEQHAQDPTHNLSSVSKAQGARAPPSVKGSERILKRGRGPDRKSASSFLKTGRSAKMTVCDPQWSGDRAVCQGSARQYGRAGRWQPGVDELIIPPTPNLYADLQQGAHTRLRSIPNICGILRDAHKEFAPKRPGDRAWFDAVISFWPPYDRSGLSYNTLKSQVL